MVLKIKNSTDHTDFNSTDYTDFNSTDYTDFNSTDYTDKPNQRNHKIISVISEKGFTLVEIMLVVIIIAALAAMIMPRLAGRSEQAKRARVQAEINSNMGLALKLYELDNGNYPTTEQGLEALMTKASTEPAPQNWQGPYLEKKPIDPWNRPYQYKCPGVHNQGGFDLYSFGKDGTEGNEDDVTNWE